METLTAILNKNWKGQKVRQFNIALNDLIEDTGHQMSFWELKEFNEEAELDRVMDEIKERYGVTSIFKGHSLTEGSTYFERAKNVGGHKGMSEVDK